MKRFPKLHLLRDDTRGATAIEYGMIATLIGMSLVAILHILGSAVDVVFLKISTSV
jgi:Flp pilus assembly pilin Flp